MKKKYMPIIQHPEKVLDMKSKIVEIPITKKDFDIINSMISIVIDSNNTTLAKKYDLIPAVGIAAVQIGILKKMFYVYVKEAKFELFAINPKIISTSINYCYISNGEGCLSLKEKNRFIVYRFYRITLKYNDFFLKKEIQRTFTAKHAIIIQHEMDHLKGILCMQRSNNQKLMNNELWKDAIAI